MRFLIPAAALFATACAKEEPAAAPGLAAGNFAAGSRDALCIAGEAGAQRGGFITYGEGDANCSASGQIEQAGASWVLNPTGDAECKIPLSVNAQGASLGTATAACAYFCGPTATFAGKAFSRSPDAKPATDLAGDPLC